MEFSESANESSSQVSPEPNLCSHKRSIEVDEGTIQELELLTPLDSCTCTFTLFAIVVC